MLHSKKAVLAAALTLGLGSLSAQAAVDSYQIDPAHSSAQFVLSHLGVSKAPGRFNDLSGSFKVDSDDPARNQVELVINTASVDTAHDKRDQHLRSPDFLDVKQYPEMTFKSTAYRGSASEGVLQGELTLHGVTKRVDFEMSKVGEGADPWGGYRSGYVATATLKRSEFGIDYFIPGVGDETEVTLFIEGIRQ